ncbi:MAG: ribosome assembly cofactor RimP, partial [Bacteroidetes bacterium]|nr:ribosome assembly cofactor RimP [Bacteroidota bacterium]
RDIEDFEIEVSSSGLDFPLQLPRQYKKNTGKEIKVIMKDGTVKKGILTEVLNDGFVLEESFITKNIKKKKEITKMPVSIAFENVKDTRIIVNI